MEEEMMNPKRFYETVNPTDADVVVKKFEFLTDEELNAKIKNSVEGF